MGVIGNLLVKLGVNTAQFTAGLASAAAASNTFSRNLASSFQNTANASTVAGNAVSVFSNNTAKGFKDVTRIAQGIIVSQMFYQTVNSIKSATAALGEFSMQCEDASVSFGVLMKDQDKANRFLYNLQDFAAKTPFTMQQSIDQARKLLAYGFSSDNMNPIMNTLADASAASGDAETFQRVGRALGQIRTKGKLAAQELLQLTEAGIPAFEILREKLHLSAKEIANIGRQGISSDRAINALLQGMQERYGGAAARMAETTRGMLSTIKDNMLIIGSELSKPLYEGFRNAVRKVRDTLDNLRDAVRDGGVGGLVQSLVPASLFPKIQIFVANLIMMKQNIGLLIKALQPFGAAMMEFVLNVMNLALPIINAINRVLIVLLYTAGQCTPFVRMLVGSIMGLLVVGVVIQLLANFIGILKGLFIVRILAQLIVNLAQAIRILALAMMSSPIIAFLGVATGALLGFGLASGKVSGWLNNIGGGISKAFGMDPSKIFAPKMKENNTQASEFNKNLGTSSDKLKDMGDAAKKAGKQAKDMIMAFDEVFNIKDEDENSDSPDAGEMGDIGDIGSIPSIPVEEPTMPDVSGTIQDWVDKFKDTILTKLKNTLIGAGIGAAIGGLIGGLIGGPEGALIGAKIGALAGGIAGYFWDQLPKQFKDMFKGAGIGATIGGLIGLIFGGPQGALIGIAIGGLAGSIAGYFWDKFPQHIRDAFKGAGIGAAIGAGLGGIFGGPAGVFIGAALGTLIGSIVGNFWEGMSSSMKDSLKAGSVGASIGAVIGGILGGPAGALIGAAIGGLVTGIVGSFYESLGTSFSERTSAFMGEIQNVWQQVLDQFKLAFSGGDQHWYEIGGHIIMGIIAGIAAAIFTVGSAIKQYVFIPIYNAICDAFGIHSPAAEMYPIGDYIIQGIWEGIKGAISSFLTSIADLGSQVYVSFSTWWADLDRSTEDWVENTKTSISGWWSETSTGFTDWCSSVKETFTNWFSDNKKGFVDWFSQNNSGMNTWCSTAYNNIVGWAKDTTTKFKDWASDNATKFKEWWADGKTGFSNWYTDTKGNVASWYTDTTSKINDWASTTSSKFSGWWSTAKTGFSTWYTDTKGSVVSWYTDTTSKINDWATTTATKISTWWTDSKTGFGTWYTETKGSVDSWYTDTYGKISTWATESYTKISGWWTDTKTGFSTWAKECFSGISEWFGSITTTIQKAINKAKDFGSTKFSTSFTYSGGGSSGDDGPGHAKGGVFNKEHIARFAEGNKAEAIIPLEDAAAMQPFVDAVAGGLAASVASMSVQKQDNTPTIQQSQQPVDTRPIMYVGTLIADDSGLKELDRRMRVITIQENQRRGSNG